MSDTEAAQYSERKCVKDKLILFLKTISHGLYLVTCLSVSVFGAVMSLSVTEEQEKEVFLKLMKYYAFGYGTIWNYLFQTGFLFLALAHDALEWASKQDSQLAKRIRYWRDVIFSGLVVPYTCFVFTMFWSLYTIDRELVFPKVYDAVVPWWFNHCVHTNILVMVVLETILQPRRQPADRRLELILNGTIGILYAVVYYSIFFLTGRWLYNVFGIFNWWQVCLFQILIWTSSYVFYEMQWPINRLIHGKEPEEQKQEQNSTEHTFQNGGSSNGDVKQENVNSKQNSGSAQNGGSSQNGGSIQNGDTNKNGAQNSITDLKVPPFSTKSWSLKYRTIRNQFENSKL